MVRTFVTSLIILFLATSGMLFWQWNVYSEDREASAKTIPSIAEQHLQVQQDDKLLQVTQTISNLKEGTYKVVNPLKVKYEIENHNAQSNTVSVATNNTSLTFRYSIPFSTTRESKLLTNWGIHLEGVQTEKTSVEITVSGNRTGSWAAGATQIGKVKKEYIDYYVFEHDGPLFPIYFQQGDFQHVKLKDGPFMYYEETDKPNMNVLSSAFSKYPTLQNSVVILTSKHRELSSNSIIMMNNTSDANLLNKKLSNMYLDSILPFKDQNEKWQQKIISNLAQNTQLGGAKVSAMVQIIKEDLSQEEIQAFVQKVLNDKKPLTASDLDQALSEIQTKNTSFFSLNKQEKSSLVPLYYLDKRKIIVNGNQIKESLLYQNNDKLLPFTAMLDKAGWEYSVINDYILLTKDGDSIRLYPNEKVFILNGTDFSVLSSPITIIQNKLYIYEHWLIDIFGASINENEQTISISIP